MNPPSVDRRPERDRMELIRTCIEIRDLVPSEALRDQLGEALRKAGVTEVRVDGQPFDARRHRAVDRVATADPGLHNIVAETERVGYVDGNTMLRQPEVTVYRAE